MESLSVSNLPELELQLKYSGVSDTGSQRYIKTTDKQLTNNLLNNSKFNLRFNFKNFNNKYRISRVDSGYMSSNGNSAETVFSIDNNNYVSFRHNLNKRQQYSSTQSLYDKSLLDLSEVFGLNFNPINKNSDKNEKQIKDSKLQTLNGKKIIEEKVLEIKFENRSWDQIYNLSDSVLNKWLANSNKRKTRVNYTPEFNGSKSFHYFEPNIEVKNSLLLNQNLLYQPIRRFTSEINLRKLVFESSELYSDDFQLESKLIADENFLNKDKLVEMDVENDVAEHIYELFMELHEFRISDKNIDSVSDKICKIDKYLYRQIGCKDIANYLFSKNVCGCHLLSICSVIKFSQHLNQIIVDCIDCKIAVYQRIAYIIAFIKVSHHLIYQFFFDVKYFILN